MNEEDLKEIEDLAYSYMLKSEIEIIMQKNVFEHDEANLAFIKGRLKRKAHFNSKLIALSDQLSSPAMNIENELAKETYLKDNLNL